MINLTPGSIGSGLASVSDCDLVRNEGDAVSDSGIGEGDFGGSIVSVQDAQPQTWRESFDKFFDDVYNFFTGVTLGEKKEYSFGGIREQVGKSGEDAFNALQQQLKDSSVDSDLTLEAERVFIKADAAYHLLLQIQGIANEHPDDSELQEIKSKATRIATGAKDAAAAAIEAAIIGDGNSVTENTEKVNNSVKELASLLEAANFLKDHPKYSETKEAFLEAKTQYKVVCDTPAKDRYEGQQKDARLKVADTRDFFLQAGGQLDAADNIIEEAWNYSAADTATNESFWREVDGDSDSDSETERF